MLSVRRHAYYIFPFLLFFFCKYVSPLFSFFCSVVFFCFLASTLLECPRPSYFKAQAGHSEGEIGEFSMLTHDSIAEMHGCTQVAISEFGWRFFFFVSIRTRLRSQRKTKPQSLLIRCSLF